MSTECVLRYIITIMARPTETSAAATTITKNTKSCAEAASMRPASTHILEKATSKRFTAFSISSMHIKMMIAFLRINTPMIPMQNRAILRKM